ncbi:sugar phosphate isomerase/epimerase [Streptomyces canus]|uniref:sugar phosphate isomerase/epimerase family protein n=1 Tax=Streptomyces canus TaxID=58343 RepID=UPI002E27CC70|nr:sugar phosphate isomerase/epimerase family protein [Streptomyces canus]
MRPCILTDEISQDLDEALEICDRQGFTAIEIRSVWNTPPNELTLRQCADIAARAADRSISIAGFASPVFKTELPTSAADLTRCQSLLASSIEQCAALGTGMVRVFSFFRDGAPDVQAAAEAIDTVLNKVPTDEVVVAIETGTRTNTPTAALGQQLVDALSRLNVGVLWDPGNTVFAGFGDGHLGGLPDLRPGSLLHVHVKDPRGTSGYVELGQGDLPWPAILAALRERGYRGHVSLETHWRKERVLTARERDEPWGEGISAGGREASEACMAMLASWLKDVA